MNKFTILVLALGLFSCHIKRNDNSSNQGSQTSNSTIVKASHTNNNESLRLDNFITDVIPAENEITIINENCGIFITPDSIQISKMKGKTEEEHKNFYVAADDNNYYQYETKNYLDSIHVKCIFPKTRYLKFLSEEDTIVFDTRSKFSPGWMVVLFSLDKPPIIIDFVSYEESYKNFLKE